jgi:hypothetical protein
MAVDSLPASGERGISSPPFSGERIKVRGLFGTVTITLNRTRAILRAAEVASDHRPSAVQMQSGTANIASWNA